MTVVELLTKGYRAANVISFVEVPSAEQGVAGLDILNGLMVRLAEDHLIPNYVQVSTMGEDVLLPVSVLSCVHYLLAIELANSASVTITQELSANATLAEAFITRQSLNPKVVTGGLPRGSGDAYSITLGNL
jgi:hypothetical protein